MARNKAIAISVDGIHEVVKAFVKFGQDGANVVGEVTQIRAREMAADAKIRAPKRDGFLHSSIHAIETSPLNWSVGTNLFYAPYMEFGTGKDVIVPAELKDLAILFKKSPPKRAVNIHPRPYLYPAFLKAKRLYLKDLAKALDRLTKKNPIGDG